VRVPATKVYRAFPEMDRFTDAECQRLVVHAGRHARITPEAGCVGRFIAVGALGLGGSLLLGWLISSMVRNADDMIPAGVFVGSLVLGIILSLQYRDRLMGHVLREQIRRTTCPTCNASLLGSHRSADTVRCGGCSAVHTFESLAIQSEDLGPALIVLNAKATCPRCGYVIGGLPIYRGHVTCPECAERTPVVENGPPVADVYEDPASDYCRNCGYSLAGLRIHRGSVKCPECGVEAPAPDSGAEERSGG
jgi:predicted Zn-ribbon and HTH transcriptional regulator